MPEAGIPSLLDITIDDIVLGLDQKLFSCADLVEAYITRTSEVNDDLRPVLQINPDALLIAKSLDAELQSGHRRGYASLLLHLVVQLLTLLIEKLKDPCTVYRSC